MDLTELRAMLPVDAQVVEFRHDATYLIAVQQEAVSHETMSALAEALRKMGINSILVQIQDIRIFEFTTPP